MKRRTIKIIHEGKFAAEVPVDLIDDDGGGPLLSFEDATKLEEVRFALRRGDIAAAAKHGRIFELTPVSV
jgi:hypothetical protein